MDDDFRESMMLLKDYVTEVFHSEEKKQDSDGEEAMICKYLIFLAPR